MATRAYRGTGKVPTEALARLGAGGSQDQVRSAVEEVTRFLEELRSVQRGLASETATTVTSSSGSAAPAPTPAPGPPGPPGPPGTPYTPDLTPPPTPSGVVVSAGLDFIFIQTDAPTFTEGNGYLRTRVYGAQYGGTGPLPTFSSAVLVHEFSGQVGSFAAAPGAQWHVWLKWQTNDGVESVSPSGGANGHQATASLIGTANLGPLIIEAGNLASGAVTAAKLAAEAVTLTAFAAGLRPVRVLAALPALPAAGYLNGDTALLTTDGKLYRIVAGAWTRALDGADLVASSVTAGAIAAGAVTATQIAAGAITTGKLLVTGQGATLTPDPMGQDSSAWTFGGVPGSFVTGVTDLPVGSTAIQSAPSSVTEVYSTLIPIDTTKDYRLEVRMKRQAGAGTDLNYLGLAWYDAAGVLLEANVAQPTGAGNPAGWTANGAYSYYFFNTVAPASWTNYGVSFGPSETARIPSNARFVKLVALLNANASVGSTIRVSSLRLWEKAGADLIVDGSIIATKLAANAIAVGTAAIQNGAIVNAMIADAAITNAKIVSLSASKIIAGSLAVGEYIQSSGFVPGTGVGFRIDGGGGVEARFSGGTRVLHLGASGSDPILRAGSAFEVLANGSATFSGTVTASAIVGSTVTGGTITGSVLQTATSGKRITLNEGGANEGRFYGDRGDGTVEQLINLGLANDGSDFFIGVFGSQTSQRIGVRALSNTADALWAETNSGSAAIRAQHNGASSGGTALRGLAVGASGRGVVGQADGDSNSVGVLGTAFNGSGIFGTSLSGVGVRGFSAGSAIGVLGESASGYGAVFTGSNLAPLFLTTVNNTSLPAGAAPGALAMVRFPSIGGGGGNVRLCYIDQFGVWRYVSDDNAV